MEKLFLYIQQNFVTFFSVSNNLIEMTILTIEIHFIAHPDYTFCKATLQ